MLEKYKVFLAYTVFGKTELRVKVIYWIVHKAGIIPECYAQLCY